jgi:hypothetical protein
MAEVVFVDGQALTPGYFGKTDTTTGAWIPQTYTGTYGTNGFYLKFNDTSEVGMIASDSATTSSAYTFTDAFTTFSTTDWVLSQNGGTGATMGVSSNNLVATSYGTGAGAWHGPQVTKSFTSALSDFDITFENVFFGNSASDLLTIRLDIGGLFTWSMADAWVDAGSDGSIKYTFTSSGTTVSTTAASTYSGNIRFVRVGTNLKCYAGTSLMADVTCVAQAVGYVSILFQQFSTNTVPTAYVEGITISGTAVGNPWTPTNISLTAGVTYDAMNDYPQPLSGSGRTYGNYAVMNPLKKYAVTTTANPTISNGGLTVSDGTGLGDETTSVATMPFPKSGQYYAEVTITQDATATASGGVMVGVIDETYAYGADVVHQRGAYRNSGTITNLAAVVQTAGPTYTTGDIIGIAVDSTNGRVQYYKNNTAVGSTPSYTFTAGTELFLQVSTDNVAGTKTFNVNFGQRPFNYTMPTGYKTLNTYNLPTPTVKSGDDYFKAYTYTGTGSGLQVGEYQHPVNTYQVARGLRFRSGASAYLSRTFGTATDGKKWTWSGWIKRSTATQTWLLGARNGALLDGGINITATGTIGLSLNGNVFNKYTKYTLSDLSAWYHVIVVYDSAQTTAADRIKFYVNGVEQTEYTTANTGLPGQNYTPLCLNTALSHEMGVLAGYATNYFDGYMADVYFVDGQALTATSFGTWDANGYWIPIAYTGTYGTNGFYLDFKGATAKITAPFGGDAYKAQRSDSSYVTSNTTTGSSFTFLQYEFDSSITITSWAITSLWFTNATTQSFQVSFSTDNVTWTNASTLTTSTTATNYNSGAINITARYIRLRATAFNLNGAASIDSFIINGTQIDSILVADKSGGTNNWTPSNISLANDTTYDWMIDSPTLYSDSSTTYNRGNYATFNQQSASSITPVYSNGSLTVAGPAATSNFGMVYSTLGMRTGKWYMEVTLTTLTSNSTQIGVASYVYPSTDTNQNALKTGITVVNCDNTTATSRAVAIDGTILTGTDASLTFAAGDIIGMAFDADAKTLKYYRNGTIIGGTQTYPVTDVGSGLFYYVFNVRNSSGANKLDANFGQRPFTYTPPTGYIALNTYNIAEVTTDLEKPDLVWIKSRGVAGSHYLFDTSRGVSKSVSSNSSAIEATDVNSLQQFNKNGFQVGSSSNVNTSGTTYAAWAWKEGVTQGFDVVSYVGQTGDNTTRSIAHSLGVTPSFMMIKNRDWTTTGVSWVVWHSAVSNSIMYLDSTLQAIAGDLAINIGAAPTSTVFNTISSTGETTTNRYRTNGRTDNYIAYLWSGVAGYSKFGSFTGNGSTDGPFVYCGFRPAFILTKNTTAGRNWLIWDSATNSYNASVNYNIPNTTDLEQTTGGTIDILSNGFKVRNSSSSGNGNGETIVFCAFAENPFKYSNAR